MFADIYYGTSLKAGYRFIARPVDATDRDVDLWNSSFRDPLQKGIITWMVRADERHIVMVAGGKTGEVVGTYDGVDINTIDIAARSSECLVGFAIRREDFIAFPEGFFQSSIPAFMRDHAKYAIDHANSPKAGNNYTETEYKVSVSLIDFTFAPQHIGDLTKKIREGNLFEYTQHGLEVGEYRDLYGMKPPPPPPPPGIFEKFKKKMLEVVELAKKNSPI
jgi:hypothetical protein